tara:strand:- start:523 stop:1521 length:999 start_codon:yes stop_codon:yes gene_type:complete
MKKKSKKKKFPDLTGDGKVTKADILKGRGVIESDDFVSEVMRRVEESELLIEQEADTIIEECNTIHRILNIDFLSLNESVDNSLINLLEEDGLDEAEFLGGLCEVFDMDPDDVSDEQINEIFGFLKNRKRADRRKKLVGRFTKGLEGKENAAARAKRRMQAHRIANEVPDGTVAQRRKARAGGGRGGETKTSRIGKTTATRNTASVYNKKSGVNNPDRHLKTAATKASGGKGADPKKAKDNYYAAVRANARAAKRKRLGLDRQKGAPYEGARKSRSGRFFGHKTQKAKTQKKADKQKTMSAGEGNEVVRGARIALAERVLNCMVGSKLRVRR